VDKDSTEKKTVVLGVDAKVIVIDDEHGLGLLLNDSAGRRVRVEVPADPDAWIAVRGLARRIEETTLPVKMATVGYLPEHGAHTGPPVFRSLPRPVLPPMVEQDPFGGPSSGAG
jgi:hypothetical protein